VRLEWLKPLQVLDVKGDWPGKAHVRPGGWLPISQRPYPIWTIPPCGDGDGRAKERDSYKDAIAAVRNGWKACRAGWRLGAFDADNSYYYLNNIPSPIMRAARSATEDVSGAVSACWRNWREK